MFDDTTSEAEENSEAEESLGDEESERELPQIRVPAEMGGEVSYAPSIMLFGSMNHDSEGGGQQSRSARKEYHVAVYVHYDGDEFMGLCGDISDGGLFVASSQIPPRSSLVEIEFLMPDSDEEFIVEAEVRWVREEWDEERKVVPGFGVRFIDVSDRAREMLEKVIAAAESTSADERESDPDESDE